MTAGRPAVPLPDPPLVEAPIVLRPWQAGDAAALAAAWEDPLIGRWTSVPAARGEADAGRWIAGDAHRRARGLSLDLVIDLDGEVAGEVGLAPIDVAAGEAEIGWWVAAGHRGRGVAASGARLLSGWAVQELAVTRVVARCHPDNPASAGVARAAGFVLSREAALEQVWSFPPA